MNMNEREKHAVLTIALMAAFADGLKDEREREQVKRVAEQLGGEAKIDLAAVYHEVLLGNRDVAAVAAELATPQTRQLAYEMAVCVCDADGARNPAEGAFLEKLRGALGLAADASEAFARNADAVAAASPELSERAAAPAAATPAPAPAPASASDRSATPVAVPAELDRTILNHAITAAALELLPESLATLAVIPVQMKLVHRIGQSFGYELDRASAKDFLATLGVGLASQYFEGFARKLLGGLLGGVGGGLGRAAGRQAASSGLAFATTYAIGHVARDYYAAGRQIDAERLKATFARMLGEAKALAGKYAGEIEAKARTIDTKQLQSFVRNV